MKKLAKFFTVSIILLITLVTLVGCGDTKEKSKSSKKENKNIENVENTNTSKNTSNSTKNTNTNTSNTSTKNNTTNNTAKAIDKTPVDYKDNSAYVFVVDGVKYSAGDKISDLSKSGLHLNKTGSEKEINKNGYLIGGGAVLNSEDKTVFNITPVNRTGSTIKGSEGAIGSFSLDKIGYDKLNGKLEITNGITYGTSLEDVVAVFGEPTSKTEGTEYVGPTYTYEVSGEYKSFKFSFDKDGKVTSIRWQNYTF